MRLHVRLGFLLVLLLVGFSAPPPMQVSPSEWPLDRLVANLESIVKASPDDGAAHYHLGRALGFAFALERSSLWALWERAELVSELDVQQERFADASRAAVTPAQALERLSGGVFHLRRACELDAVPPGLEGQSRWEHDWWTARKHLTLAWLLETGAHLADRMDTPRLLGVQSTPSSAAEEAGLQSWIAELGSPDSKVAVAARDGLARQLEQALPFMMQHLCSPDASQQKAVAGLLERYWIERSIREYWSAYSQNVQKELEIGGWELERLVSYEALLGYERLVHRRGIQSPEEEERILEMQRMRKQFEEHPRGEVITPIVLSIGGCKALDDLVVPNLAVPFDLDGDGIDELWPWIAPDAGWLVWDPNHQGEITSGQQLFGTASAWLFFE